VIDLYTDYIPKEWRDILADIRQVAPGAIIAGGALRDLYNGVPVKDIDIFVPAHQDYPSTDRVLKTAQYVKGPTAIIHYHGPDPITSIEWTKYGRLPVSIIVDPTPSLDLAWVQRFDFTTSQIIFDGGAVEMSRAFINDSLAKVFRYSPRAAQNDVARSKRRWARISQKYPGWTAEFPPEPPNPFDGILG